MLPFSAWCQDTLFTPIKIIQPLTAYRSKILEENPKAIDQIEVLMEKWGEIVTELNEEEEFFMLIFHSLYMKNRYQYSTEFICKFMSRRYKKTVLRYGIEESDIELFLKCSQFFDLIAEGIVISEYPYVLEKPEELYRELNFYEIQAGHKIAELGAGTGFFSLLLGLISSEIDITVNEIDKYAVRYTQTRLDENASLLDTSRVKTVVGSKSDTKLTKNTYDRIIIRNSFHHFSKEKKMLASIKEALKQDGKLCLYEPITERRIAACKKVLAREDLISTITKGGFKLIKEDDAENFYGYILLMFEIDVP